MAEPQPDQSQGPLVMAPAGPMKKFLTNMEATDTKVGESPAPSPMIARKAGQKPKPPRVRRKVIVAIDTGPESEEALLWYAENLHYRRNRMVLVHVADPPFVCTQQVMYMSSDMWAQLVGQEKEKVKELEDKFADIMKQHGMSGRIKALFHNRPGEAIVDVANDEKADLVVLGTRNHASVRRTVLGSVSDYVLHHAHCPVGIFRKMDMHRAPRKPTF